MGQRPWRVADRLRYPTPCCRSGHCVRNRYLRLHHRPRPLLVPLLVRGHVRPLRDLSRRYRALCSLRDRALVQLRDAFFAC